MFSHRLSNILLTYKMYNEHSFHHVFQQLSFIVYRSFYTQLEIGKDDAQTSHNFQITTLKFHYFADFV